MDASEALVLLERELGPSTPVGLRIEEDDAGYLAAYLRVDLYHLDADALNDRLHAWVVRDVQPVLPGATALVSFRNARPATMDDPELEFEEPWLGLEPMFRLDLVPPPTAEEVRRFARLVPTFVEVAHGFGRPEGWRDVHVGSTE